MQEIEIFRRPDGWLSHWSREHKDHFKVFPDTPFVTGMYYTALIYLERLDARVIQHFKNGYYSRKQNDIPGGLIRDLDMTGEPHEKMLNRDQWSALIIPTKVIQKDLSNFKLWRRYARTKPRHWLMPNHALFFERVISKPGKLLTWVGDFFEYQNCKTVSIGNHDSVMHTVNRLAFAILNGYRTKTVVKAWNKLNSRMNVKAEFTAFAVSPIPGDPPGEHPRIDKPWWEVMDLVNETLKLH